MMDMKAPSTGGVVVDQQQLHAPLPEDDNDVMVDLSCFGGGCYNLNAAMEEADHQDLMDNAAAIFCDDLIPPLPDFQCMSSSSSSSSSSAAVKPAVSASYRSTASSSVSSSSASSWAVLRSDGEDYQHATAAAASNSNYLQNNNNHQQVALSSTASVDPHPPIMLEQNNYSNNGLLADENEDDDDIGCMDVMETLGYMDLLDDNSQAVWDYNDSFNSQQNNLQEQHLEGFHCNQQTDTSIQFKDGVHVTNCDKKGDNLDDIDGIYKSEDLAMVFFEWLKSNKESISAEDLRSIKLRKSTIESAARRLGNGKEGMKRLLQLILEWVQHHQLQRKRSREEADAAAAAMGQAPQFQQHMYPNQPFQNTTADSNLNVQPDHHTQFAGSANQAHWNMNMGSGGGSGFDPMMAVGVPAAGAGIINGDTFGNNSNRGCHHFSNMIDQSASAWPPAPPFCMNYNNNANAAPNLTQQPYPFGTTFNQYPYHYYPAVGNGNNNVMNGNVNEEGLVRTGSSATKEARKKRMMRQRRFLPHHRHHHHNNSSHSHHHSNNGHSNQITIPIGALNTATSLSRFNVDENCANMGHPGSGSWTYWQTAAPRPPIPLVSNVGKPIQANDVGSLPLQQRPTAPERRQGSKPEKNLRFLLQKVLKQSDVGSLGRIVLPKKEAEIHLPQLTARDGINIAMEDIGTSQVWNMRYRFWPNNKSRMYLLENTGDFVKSNGLQEGDFIVIYSDIKCGKYMIRGVKVRQQGQKSEARRCGKALKKNPSPTSNSSPSGTPNNKDALLKSGIEGANMDLQMLA